MQLGELEDYQETEPERILCAAILYDGKVITGYRHGDCYATIENLSGEILIDKLPPREKQGFLTSYNRYVGREEAWIIAKKQDQVKFGPKEDVMSYPSLPGLELPPDQKMILISENLY